MLSQERIENLILARYFYSYGLQYSDVSDTIYETDMTVLRETCPNHWLVTTHYSNDPVPYELLNKYNIPLLENKLTTFLDEEELPEEIIKLREEYFNYYEGRFSDTSQKSIRLIQDYDTIYQSLEEFGNCRMHLSIKADGQNFTAVYFRGNLIFGRTKGRTGNPFDITKVLRIILPPYLFVDEEVIIISGELVCYKSSLPYLRSRYHQRFKNTRSAVTSLLHGGLDREDIFNHLKPLVFKVRSDELHTLTEEFIWAKEHGFNTPVHMTFDYNSWNDLINAFNYFFPLKEQLPYSSDGLVLAIDDNDVFYAQGDTDHHYLGNLALKVGVWDPGYYVGIVIDIKWSYGEQVITPEAIIEPVRISTGNDVESIPLDNIRRMIEHDIRPGSEIYFKITSDTKISLVHEEEELENIRAENRL